MDTFSGTKPVAEQHAFDTRALQAYLHERHAGFDGELRVEQFKGGQSNPTYKLITPQPRLCDALQARPGHQAAAVGARDRP